MDVVLRPPKVTERKLGREKALGQECHGFIEIDPRQSEHEYLDTLIHECLHAHFPDLTEQQVVKIANSLTKILWKAKYRRIRA